MSVSPALAALLERPISQRDRDRAALLMLDWTGCCIAGQMERPGQIISQTFADEMGQCARIGSTPASPMMAALHNGCLGNILEMDDVDKRAILHAAPTIMPAALAIAQSQSQTRSISSQDLLDAIIKGYETTIRIGRAVGPGHYAFWHNTATCGPFGAAVAACHLIPDSDVISAWGLAGTQAAGLWQTRHEPNSMAKHLHAGHAAHAGVLAAMLSAQGFQGPRAILDGPQGFFAAMCPGADPQDILIDAESDWHIHGTSLKPYPSCRHTHPAIDAALETKDRLTQHSMIEIKTYSDALTFCDNPNPQTSIEAKFSLQHCVALTLLSGPPTLSDFNPERIQYPALIALRHRIRVSDSAQFNDAYPQHYGASIQWDTHVVTVKDAYGDPENPLSLKAVTTKAAALMSHADLSTTQIERLIQATLALADGGDLQAYIEALP